MTLVERYADQYNLDVDTVRSVTEYIDPETQPSQFRAELESLSVVNMDWLDRLFVNSVQHYYSQGLV